MKSAAALLGLGLSLSVSASSEVPRVAAVDPARLASLHLTQLALSTPTGTMSAADQPGWQSLWLELSLNGQPLKELVEVLAPAPGAEAGTAADLRMPAAQWQALGLVAAAWELDEDQRVRLDALTDVTFTFDAAAQRLALTLPASRFRGHVHALQSRESRLPDALPVSAALNYDVFAQHLRPPVAGSDNVQLSGFLEGRLTGAWGSLYQSGVSSLSSTGENGDVRRLETSYRYYDPADLVSWQVGDAITAGLQSRPALRFGGVQWRRNFSLRPDLITAPTTGFSGSSAVPATVDILVDQIQRARLEVPAGPFAIQELPVFTGPHQVQIVVRDALGRDQITTLNLFSSPQLLATGLSDFALQGGLLRGGFNTDQDAYADSPFVQGSLRHGLTSGLTLEGQLEGAEKLVVATGGLTTLAGRSGVVGLSLSGSQVDGVAGAEGTVRLDYYLAKASQLQLTATQASSGFSDLSQREQEGSPRLRQRHQVSFSHDLGQGANIGIGYIGQQDQDGERFRSVFASLSQSFLGRGYVSLSLNQQLDDERDLTLGAGVSWMLDNELMASARATRNRQGSTGQLALQSQLPQDRGWGWRVEASEGEQVYQRAELLNRNRYSDLTAMMESSDSGLLTRLGASGALAWMPGTLLPGRRINDAFAIVDLGYPDVPIFVENRPVGQTGSSGKLLIPDMNAYLLNKVSLSADHLPFTVEISDAARHVVPGRDGGLRVSFDTQAETDALLRLQRADGSVVPMGARLVLPATHQVIGHDGMVLVPVALAGRTLDIYTDRLECRLSVPEALVADAQRALAVEITCSE